MIPLIDHIRKFFQERKGSRLILILLFALLLVLVGVAQYFYTRILLEDGEERMTRMELTSHTAATNMIGPLAITAALSAGISPVPVSVGIALSASLGFMLPVSTPPNAIVYASGYIPITKMIKTGVYIDFIGIACVTIPLAIYFVNWITGM